MEGESVPLPTSPQRGEELGAPIPVALADCQLSVPGMKLHVAALLLVGLTAPALAVDPPASALQNTSEQDGLLPVHVDRRGGRILLSLPAPDGEGISGRFIYVAALETGLGSAPLGLDRALSRGSPVLGPPPLRGE